MRITQVKLRNIGPHRQLDVKFDRGLIGLVGPNGAGKSTLVNAIYAALTNDFSRFSNVKSDIITNGSGKEDSYIRLCGVHRNQAFELTRWLRPNKNEFTIGDVSYTKANEVNDVITAQLNISKLVIDKYVFVDQWDMFGFLSQTASERAKTFQYLCGTEIAATIHKVCSDYVTKQKGYEVVDNSLELEESLAVAAQSMAEHRQTMGECQARLLTPAEHKTYQQILHQRVQAESAADELEAQQEQQRRWQQALTTAKEQLALAETRRNKMERWQQARTDQIKAAGQLLEHRTKHTLARQQQKKLETQIGNLKANLEQLEDDWAKLDPDAHLEPETRKVLVQQQHTLHVLREQAKKLLNMAAEAQCCALCNQPVTPEYVEQVKAEYRRNTTKFRLLEKQIEFADEYDAGLANYTRDKAQNQTDLALAETRLEACLAQLEGPNSDQDYQEAEALLAKFQEADNRLVEAMTAVTKYHRQMDVARGQLAGLELAIQTRQEILDNAPTAAECQDAEQRLAQHVQDTNTYEAARGAYEEAKRAHTRTGETLAQLRLRLAEKTKIRNLLATISEAGDVFHWNNLPKTVSQANLELLVGDINENLELFNSPFFVESDSDLTFKVYFPGKPAVKAKQLSGGQKVVLAIAFRAALDRVFGHDVGMMFLDEPTSGLDADNVNFFHEALQQLSQKVGGERQLVVITHVQDLGGVFDQLIEIHKD